jgi:hypothetical protein
MLLLIIPTVWVAVIVVYVSICVMASRGDRLTHTGERAPRLSEMRSVSTVIGDLLVVREGPGRMRAEQTRSRARDRDPGTASEESWSDYLLSGGSQARGARASTR